MEAWRIHCLLDPFHEPKGTQTDQCCGRDDLCPSCCPNYQFDLPRSVDEDGGCHGGKRSLPFSITIMLILVLLIPDSVPNAGKEGVITRFYEIVHRRRDAKVVVDSRSSKVIHLIIVDYSSPP